MRSLYSCAFFRLCETRSRSRCGSAWGSATRKKTSVEKSQRRGMTPAAMSEDVTEAGEPPPITAVIGGIKSIMVGRRRGSDGGNSRAGSAKA